MKCSEAQETLPESVKTVADLLEWLGQKSVAFQDILESDGSIHVAVDQRHAQAATSVIGASEIALFPPVTGG